MHENLTKDTGDSVLTSRIRR